MNKATFLQLTTQLETRIQQCEHYLAGLKTASDLEQLTIRQAQEVLDFCKKEQSTMTKIVQVDLYHLIGMGGFTPPQMTKFTYLIKDYLQYRCIIKALAYNFDKITSLPNISVCGDVKYTLQGFSDLTLSVGEGKEEILPSKSLYTISGDYIKVAPDKLTEFILFWSTKTKIPYKEVNLKAKAESGAEYGGIRWAIDTDGNYVGLNAMEGTHRALWLAYQGA